MNQLSSILRDSGSGLHGRYFSFWCPGCDSAHNLKVEGEGAWSWNGSLVRPTFTPSIKVTWPANPDAEEEFKEWRTERICHSFVKDGRIQFLPDCTHKLAGQTVDLPDWTYNANIL